MHTDTAPAKPSDAKDWVSLLRSPGCMNSLSRISEKKQVLAQNVIFFQSESPSKLWSSPNSLRTACQSCFCSRLLCQWVSACLQLVHATVLLMSKCFTHCKCFAYVIAQSRIAPGLFISNVFTLKKQTVKTRPSQNTLHRKQIVTTCVPKP